MKRFLVFSYERYEGCGGWNDFVGSADTIVEAKDYFNKYMINQIIDTLTMEIVFEE